MFPEKFLFGAASAAYQCEGAAKEGGRGDSIWDVFCREPGRIMNGDTGDTACDHYHLYREDVALMKKIGLRAYRFSIAWPRIFPDGTGKVNEEGVAFYRSLLTELKNAGIVPFITLYHWDLPAALYDRGGWMNPESADWFANYARTVAETLGDLAENFITFNEPSVFIKGMINGRHAPGIIADSRAIVRSWHNIVMAHMKAVRAMRSVLPNAKIGVAPCSMPFFPAKESDEEACREAFFDLDRKVIGSKYDPHRDFCNVPNAFLDPVVFGKYPEKFDEFFATDLPEGYAEELKNEFSPIDFIAENIYQGRKATLINGKLSVVPPAPGYPRTAIDWPVTPECMYYMLKFIYGRYRLPMMISENGISCTDWVSRDGAVHDPNRTDYIERHLIEAGKAIKDGVDLFAYFYWSFTDNMEWARGYFDRFGLVYVDYETKKRIPKDSAFRYSEIIRTSGKCL